MKDGEEVEDIDSERYDSFQCGENLVGELIKRIWSLKYYYFFGKGVYNLLNNWLKIVDGSKPSAANLNFQSEAPRALQYSLFHLYIRLGSIINNNGPF